MDDVWRVDTSRRDQERAKIETIRFDAPIIGWPNPTRLNDALLEHDLITAKLLVYLSLEPSPIGWLSTASSVAPFHRRHLNYIRFRYEWNIRSNSELRASHVRQFELGLRTPGVEGLLRVRSKAIRLVEALRDGQVDLPSHSREYFFHEGVEALLGLSLNQTPPEAIEILQQYAVESGQRFQRNERTGVSAQVISTSKRRTSVATLMSPFFHLSRLRDHFGHDPIGHDAFLDPTELATALKGWTDETTRTSDSPPLQTSWLIAGALRLILSDLPEQIVQLCRASADRRKKIDIAALANLNSKLASLGFGVISPFYMRSRWEQSPDDSIGLRELLFTVLPGACAIVIAAFSRASRRQKYWRFALAAFEMTPMETRGLNVGYRSSNVIPQSYLPICQRSGPSRYSN
ncbi:MAG: hypothetical protein U5N27_04320 [Rhizobium sp.]|nr:hypothetical protein [Rhizobium sp.]